MHSEARRQKLPPRDRRRAPKESVAETLANDLNIFDIEELVFGRWPSRAEPAVVPYTSPYVDGKVLPKIGDLIKNKKTV